MPGCRRRTEPSLTPALEYKTNKLDNCCCGILLSHPSVAPEYYSILFFVWTSTIPTILPSKKNTGQLNFTSHYQFDYQPYFTPHELSPPFHSVLPSLTISLPPSITTFSCPPSPSPTTWSSHLRTGTIPPAEIFFSTLATTRANAGGLAAQRALEHDANLELARAAKEAGAKVYVLVSAVGANASSRFPYLKLKGDIEESILALGFERTVILRPQMIDGQREERRLVEGVVRGIARVAGSVSKPWLKDWWSQDAEEIARAAVSAGVRAWKAVGEGGGRAGD
ncbi:hypothetical protein ACJ72_03076 [Emergomyces africanus]|uniref:NAD(P)-binding domain-containing protein n=1 Tax=Emergomyces africanus TaxID=1955775 RepID=A0A1B7P0M6_9EURO|nr:hypothetical protein ACJ72_03076 [Emergomyces africanus]